ncbi:hypothetical protein HHL23_08335 [Chryseobacterium sp. RP-3-3]|uniref:Por secretion system C-terminal sorting domain-containing protein n=1 Tax=Chryseobacterium antibioticum TaxID=2728847 RepID=A0A7Y0AM02_9FLAO|nr:hypothetical protein [Chryseobacterium antibioticum]NML69803.1 hypothetical protein [Chryseobacterium antibioticum]
MRNLTVIIPLLFMCFFSTSFIDHQNQWENEITDCGLRMKFVKLRKTQEFEVPCKSQTKKFVIEYKLNSEIVKLDFYNKNKQLLQTTELSGTSKKEISLDYSGSFLVQISSKGGTGSVLIKTN